MDDAVEAVAAPPVPGPLAGIRIVEVGGIGPVPFAGMMLADLGAEVIRVDRPGGIDTAAHHVLLRGRRSVVLDLKHPADRDVVLALVETADALVEGFRPGVMERLGLGPDEALACNPRLVYARMTGWGQAGPLAHRAGHDINYIALAGVLEPLAAPDGTPVPPLNMLGDFGGGSTVLVSGLLAALLHAAHTGEGQVLDASVVDGTALLTSMLHSLRSAGAWGAPRGHNVLDGGAPFYRVYETADGGWMAVGALEPQFYARLLDGLGFTAETDVAGVRQDDVSQWPMLHEAFAARFRERSRSQWETVFDTLDACVTPVLSPDEVATHPAARRSFVDVGGTTTPAPSPRFSRTSGPRPEPAPEFGAHTNEVFTELGIDLRRR